MSCPVRVRLRRMTPGDADVEADPEDGEQYIACVRLRAAERSRRGRGRPREQRRRLPRRDWRGGL